LFIEPTAGFLYDGEVINSLSELKKSFWDKHPQVRKSVRQLVNSITTGDLVSFAFDWLTPQDKIDFEEYVKILRNKIGSKPKSVLDP
jgi:hypothetical protein